MCLSLHQTSDNAFWAIIFDCWKAGKIFAIQHLDLNLSQQDLQFFENLLKKINFEFGFCISRGDNP